MPAGAVLTNKRGQLQLRHRDVDSLIRDLRCVHVHQQIHRGLASSSWFGDVLSTVTKAAGIGDTKELVGVDRGGNQYFEDKGAKGNYNSQFKRIVEPPKGM